MFNKIKNLFFPTASFILLLLCWHLASKLTAADGNSTQLYSPSRYVLMAAEINVSSLQETMPNTRKVLLQADTATGRCWVLELTVPGAGNFNVSNAKWKAVPMPQNQ